MHNCLFLWMQIKRGSTEAQVLCWWLVWGCLVGFCLFRARASRCQESWLGRCCHQASMVRHTRPFELARSCPSILLGIWTFGDVKEAVHQFSSLLFPLCFLFPWNHSHCDCFLLALSVSMCLKWALRKAWLCWAAHRWVCAEAQSFVTRRNSTFCRVIKTVFSVRQTA